MACELNDCCNEQNSAYPYRDTLNLGACFPDGACTGGSGGGCLAATTCAYCDSALSSGGGQNGNFFTNSVCSTACVTVPEFTFSTLSSISILFGGSGLILVSSFPLLCVAYAVRQTPALSTLRSFIPNWVFRLRRILPPPPLLRRFGEPFLSGTILFIEFLLLRLYLKYVLQIKLGFSFGTDYDFVPYAILAYFLLLSVLGKNEKAPLFLQKTVALIHGASFLTVLIVTFIFKSFASYTYPLFMAFWFSLVSFTLVSSLFLWRSPSYFLKHSKRRMVWPALLLSLSGLISRTIFDFLWEPITHMTGIVSYRVLSAILSSLTYKLNFAQMPTRIDEYTLLTHPQFGIAIGRGCGGLEGIILFLGVFVFFVVANRKRFSLPRWFALGSLGIIYMYMLNVLRLSLFFLGSLGAIQLWGNKTGVHFANTIFHNSIGWVLYGAGLALFFKALRKPWKLLSTRQGLVCGQGFGQNTVPQRS